MRRRTFIQILAGAVTAVAAAVKIGPKPKREPDLAKRIKQRRRALAREIEHFVWSENRATARPHTIPYWIEPGRTQVFGDKVVVDTPFLLHVKQRRVHGYIGAVPKEVT